MAGCGNEANVWQPRKILDIDADNKSVAERIVSLQDQSTFYLSEFAYALGTGALTIHKNGLLLSQGVDWVEQTTTSFSTVVACDAGDILVATGMVGITGTVDNTSYSEETVTLAAGQTTVLFPTSDLTTSAVYIGSQGVDRGRLIKSVDYTVTNTGAGEGQTAEIELAASYPAGTYITAVAVDVIGSTQEGVVKSKTLADAIADGTVIEGNRVIITDRGNGLFEYKSGETANDYNKKACTGVPSLTLVLQYDGTIYADQFGIPTGTDITASTVVLNTEAQDYDRIVFRESDAFYQVGKVTFTKKLIIDMSGTFWALIGENAGFNIVGQVDYFRVTGGLLVGQFNDWGLDSSKSQIGWQVANNVGDDAEDIIIRDVQVEQVNVGIKVAYGTAPFESSFKVYVIDCDVSNSVGKTGGMGYGVQFAQASNAQIQGGVIYGCDRHGLYFSEGERYQAINVDISGCGYNDGTIRGAVNIARSATVTMSNMNIHNNNDVGLLVDTDSQGEVPLNILDGVTVTGNTFRNNKYGEIAIGSLDPATDGFPVNVTIGVNTIQALDTSTVATVRILSGKDIHFTGNTIVSSPLSRMFDIQTQGAGYTQDIYIKGNVLTGGTYTYQVAADLVTGTESIVIEGNTAVPLTGEYNFLGAGEEGITNPALRYKRSNGKCIRDYTGTSSSVNIGGVDTLRLACPSATTINDLVGGEEGQEITFHFKNGNATLAASYFYNDAAGNFVGTQHDTAKYVYSDGRPRMISKSVNF